MRLKTLIVATLGADLATCMSLQRNFRVVGGGLAGLGVTYHLLQEASTTKHPIQVQVVDEHVVGQGGASAVAGGLIHPLSPRGKLVHWGLEGLQTTNALVEQAHLFNPQVILRDELYRIAIDEKQSQTFQVTADRLPHMATWLPREELLNRLGDKPSSITIESEKIRGGILLSNGCKVIHVPSYLDGLWQACRNLAKESDSTLTWVVNEGFAALADDSSATSIFCVGANGLRKVESLHSLSLPAQLVRGQSVELSGSIDYAMLSGKYVSPMIDGRTLIGATHEFELDDERSQSQVIQELQERTAHMCSWDVADVYRMTSGVRVQSNRGRLGRRPIVGRAGDHAWIFTGLSSRGLLYHGLYGEKLAKAIMRDNENTLLEECPEILWWKG